MKKGLLLGIAAGVAAVAGAVLYFKKKQDECCCDDDDMNADLECDSCCGDCCDYDDTNGIPAEKAEESMIVTDACVACASTEDEALSAAGDDSDPEEL
ncbi:MAG: hypothetical protein ACI4JB_11790 [Porcipelethomonas sp.]